MADAICITSRGKPVKAKTLGQEAYVEAIRDNTVVFGIGPAGTGKRTWPSPWPSRPSKPRKSTASY